MTVQFIELAGKKMALLPADDYARLLELAEDRLDVEAAIRAEARRHADEEYLPAALVDRLLTGENPLKVWREYRGLTQGELAKRAKVDATMISKLERGLRMGRVNVWRMLAAELNCTTDDIMPEN